MTSYRKFLSSVCTLIFIACSSTSSSVDSVDNRSQSIDSDVVQVTVSGDGPTKDQAVQSALRNAIEQSYGTFLSSNTKFLNDELIQDEITSVARGNILGYDLVSVAESKEGVTAFLTAQVSLTKLAQFAQSKGQSVSVNSNIVYMNAAKEDFYEKKEYQVVQDYLASYNNIALFDYELDVQDPVRCSKQINDRWFYYRVCEVDTNYGSRLIKDRWVYPIQIKFVPNENYREFYFGLINLLESISIDSNTIEFREKIGLYVGTLYIANEIKFKPNFKDRVFSNVSSSTPAEKFFDIYRFRNPLTVKNIRNQEYTSLYNVSQTHYSSIRQKKIISDLDDVDHLSSFIRDKMFNDYNLFFKKKQKLISLKPRKIMKFIDDGVDSYYTNFLWKGIFSSEMSSYYFEHRDDTGVSSHLSDFIDKRRTPIYESYVYFDKELFKDVTGFEIKPKF